MAKKEEKKVLYWTHEQAQKELDEVIEKLHWEMDERRKLEERVKVLEQAMDEILSQELPTTPEPTVPITPTPTPTPGVRDRGPKSTRTMTEDDARRVMMGDLKDKTHKEVAILLGLSYGQIYSARLGYTFTKIFELSKKKK